MVAHITIKNFQLLANFNAWANTKIISSCKQLDYTEYKKDRGAFFSSIHGTLNHLLVVDRLYIYRMNEKDHGLKSMDQILYENINDLEQARIKEDKCLVDFVNNLSEKSFHEGNEITLINIFSSAIFSAAFNAISTSEPVAKTVAL